MKGLVKFALGMEGVALQELPEPSPKEGELKVKVLAAGICNSDIHAIHDERSVTMPVVMGHEYVGQVVESCGDVGDFKVGDWVVTLPACYSCGECYLCEGGFVTLCRERKSIGSHRNGAMANYVVVPAKYSFKVSESAKTLEQKLHYALSEPLACMVRGVYEKLDVKPGDTVVISGPGIMGQLAVQLFKLKGAYVIVSGLPADQDKLDLAKEYGADCCVTSFDELQKAVYANNPKGADITCDCTGVTPSLESCMKVIRPMGSHLQIGLFGGKVPFRLDYMFDREVNYIPSNSSAVSSWEIAMDLLGQGKIDLAPYITQRFSLDEWKAGVDAVLSKTTYKVVLTPDNSFEE
ncbi:MAG: alcohol dehydrogenase catalytic domain-containing protein [Oscillospiraceae bacterium]|nr:alcohol dehydrogenase catalytic domain-containing protein [Oscillospiraceae bacterium]